MKKIILFLILGLSLTGCTDSQNTSSQDKDVQTAAGVTLFESKDSQKKWLLRADKVDFQD